jgi:hypothetical protein
MELPASGPRLRHTNWVWLALRTEGVVCELAACADDKDLRLEGLFSEVIHVKNPSELDGRYAEGMIDAFVLHALPSHQGNVTPAEMLRDCHRFLRPGGYVVFAADHSRWHRLVFERTWLERIRNRSSNNSWKMCTIGAAHQLLRSSGFTSVRCYVGQGSSTSLENLVPVSGPALVAASQKSVGPYVRRTARRLLTHIGLGSMFYRTLLVFGYK